MSNRHDSTEHEVFKQLGKQRDYNSILLSCQSGLQGMRSVMALSVMMGQEQRLRSVSWGKWLQGERGGQGSAVPPGVVY